MAPGNNHSPAFSLYQFLWTSINWLFPPRCVNCNIGGTLLCKECASEFKHVAIKTNSCQRCGELLFNGACSRCARIAVTFDKIISVGYYQGCLREVVRSLKYRRNLGLGMTLLPEFLSILEDQKIDLVVPVPLGKARQKQRGFNQSVVLAFPIALAKQVEFSGRAVRRIRETRTQVGLNIEQRIKNVKNAFIGKSELIEGKRVLLVDDVITTGATINDCSRAIREAGAVEVIVCTLARVNSSQGFPDLL